jgi:hypothetical protein
MENLLHKGLTLSEGKANELHQKFVGRIAGERLLWRYRPCRVVETAGNSTAAMQNQ